MPRFIQCGKPAALNLLLQGNPTTSLTCLNTGPGSPSLQPVTGESRVTVHNHTCKRNSTEVSLLLCNKQVFNTDKFIIYIYIESLFMKIVNPLFSKKAILDIAFQQPYQFTAMHNSLRSSSPSVKFKHN